MEKTEESLEKRMNRIRLFLGFFLILFGIIFMAIPFIPLGYLFLIMGLFFISPIIPLFRKILEKVERRDRRGRVRKARKASEKVEKRIDGKIEKLKRKRKQN